MEFADLVGEECGKHVGSNLESMFEGSCDVGSRRSSLLMKLHSLRGLEADEDTGAELNPFVA